MKQIITNNTELLEVLSQNGIEIMCDEEMRMILTDEAVMKLNDIVKEVAPAAIYDYSICEL